MGGAAWALGLVLTAACAGAARAQQLQPGSYPAVDPALYAPPQVVGAPTGVSAPSCCSSAGLAPASAGTGCAHKVCLPLSALQAMRDSSSQSAACTSGLCESCRSCAASVVCTLGASVSFLPVS